MSKSIGNSSSLLRQLLTSQTGGDSGSNGNSDSLPHVQSSLSSLNKDVCLPAMIQQYSSQAAGDSVDDSQQWFNADVWQSSDIDFDSVILQSGEDLGISNLTMKEITDQLLCTSDMKEDLSNEETYNTITSTHPESSQSVQQQNVGGSSFNFQQTSMTNDPYKVQQTSASYMSLSSVSHDQLSSNQNVTDSREESGYGDTSYRRISPVCSVPYSQQTSAHLYQSQASLSSPTVCNRPLGDQSAVSSSIRAQSTGGIRDAAQSQSNEELDMLFQQQPPLLSGQTQGNMYNDMRPPPHLGRLLPSDKHTSTSNSFSVSPHLVSDGKPSLSPQQQFTYPDSCADFTGAHNPAVPQFGKRTARNDTEQGYANQIPSQQPQQGYVTHTEARYRHASADNASQQVVFPSSYHTMMSHSSQMPVQLVSPTSTRPLAQTRPTDMASPTPGRHSLGQHSVSTGTNPASYPPSNPRGSSPEPTISPQSVSNQQTEPSFDFNFDPAMFKANIRRRQYTEELLKSCGLYEPTLLTARMVRRNQEIEEGVDNLRDQLELLSQSLQAE